MGSDKEAAQSQTGPAGRRLSEERQRYHAAKKRAWEKALVRHQGNIAHASLEFGFGRQRGAVVTKRYGLSEFARQLRVASGQPPCGRPRTSVKKERPERP